MTRPRGGITRNLLARQFPYRVALPAGALRGAAASVPIHTAAKELGGALPGRHIQREGGDSVVFHFATADAAHAFHARFGGELLPLDDPRRRR
jgi:hypothetical protein